MNTPELKGARDPPGTDQRGEHLILLRFFPHPHARWRLRLSALFAPP